MEASKQASSQSAQSASQTRLITTAKPYHYLPSVQLLRHIAVVQPRPAAGISTRGPRAQNRGRSPVIITSPPQPPPATAPWRIHQWRVGPPCGLRAAGRSRRRLGRTGRRRPRDRAHFPVLPVRGGDVRRVRLCPRRVRRLAAYAHAARARHARHAHVAAARGPVPAPAALACLGRGFTVPPPPALLAENASAETAEG